MSELYELPDGWEWKNLKSICEIINGRAYKKSELLSEGKYPVLRVGNFFTNNNWYYSDLELPENKYCENGDLLYAWSASFGPKIWDGEKSIYHYHIWKVIPDETLVTKDFLYQLLDWDVEKIKSDQGTGTTMIHVTKGSMEARNVPLPPLQEQKRIVSKLDTLFEKIDKAIALHETNMDEADAFMGSVLNEVFGELEEKYEKELWNDVLSIKNGKHYKDVIDDNGQYPIYGSGGIMNYANQYICNEDTVIIGRKGTINSPIFVKEKFWNIDTAFGIEANRDILLPMFLFYFSKHFNFLDLNKSTTLPSLAKTHLLQINMVVPPLSIQEKVVIYLDEITQKTEKVKQVQKEKMESLKALKASLLDQAFRGEL